MITVTKLNKSVVIVNADLIEFVECTPDTLITLVTGTKIMVMESSGELVEKVLEFRQMTRSHPVPVVAQHPRKPRERR